MAAVNRDLLKEGRDRKDLSNAELAELVRISPNYLDNVLCGADEPSMRLVYRFCRVLNLDENDLLLDGEKPDSQPAPAQPAAPRPKDPSGPRRRQDSEPTKAPRRTQGSAA